uniref:RNA-directed RNA polymerase C-terminal domain-containing protein n=1 Tax=Riboviria sp. TaxID=2585031 RepID=A0A8K1U2A0_9VIRU|nr:MAG: hypothetical protein 2 [Riboviria sp.]
MLSGAWSPDLDWETAFFDALDDLDPKSTPGYCTFAQYGTTIGEILGYDETAVGPDNPSGYTNGTQVESLKQYVLERMRILDETEHLIFDPIKVFIKKEPHKVKKIQEERYRIISAVSMVDTMIDRILFREFFAWMKTKNWPCYYGYVPVIGGYRTPKRLFHGKGVKSSDKQSWDWTAQEWVFLAIMWTMKNKAIFGTSEEEEQWFRVTHKRFTALYRHAVFQFADGHKIAQKKWGIQKSGCYGTLAFNSLSQFFLELRANEHLSPKTPLMCVGDDVLVEDDGRDVGEYIKALQDCGCIVKDVVVSSAQETFEFCGFEYHRDRMPTPAYRAKHLFALAHCKLGLEAETLASYQLLYAHDPFLRTIQKALMEYHPDGIKTTAQLRATWDG